MSENQVVQKKKPSKLRKSKENEKSSIPAKIKKNSKPRKTIKEHKTLSTSSKIKLIMKNIKKTQSLRHIMSFIKIFRAVLNEENNDNVVIEEGDVFNDIMKFALTKLPAVLKDVLNLVFIIFSFYWDIILL